MHFLLRNQQRLLQPEAEGEGSGDVAVLSRKQFFLLMGIEGAWCVCLDPLGGRTPSWAVSWGCEKLPCVVLRVQLPL